MGDIHMATLHGPEHGTVKERGESIQTISPPSTPLLSSYQVPSPQRFVFVFWIVYVTVLLCNVSLCCVCL